MVKPPGPVRGWQRLRTVCRLKLSFSFSLPRLCKCLLIKTVKNILSFLPPNSLHCFGLGTAYQSNFLSLSFSRFYCLRPEQSEFLLFTQNCQENRHSRHTGWPTDCQDEKVMRFHHIVKFGEMTSIRKSNGGDFYWMAVTWWGNLTERESGGGWL